MMSFSLILVVALVACVSAWQTSNSNRFTSRQAFASRLSMVSDGRRPLMGGNWKLNPTTLEAATKLTKDLASLTKDITTVDTIIFPPFPLLAPVHTQVSTAHSKIQVGAQDVFYETSGAFTGAVSTNLLKEVGASYVLVGHSERRTIFKEDDNTINRKVKKALKDGLKPLLCIGESKEEYEAGLNQQVCAIQLLKDLQGVSAEDMQHVVIAYEPVWAIGTGLVCPKEVAQSVHAFIRKTIADKYGKDIARKVIIQYGGSVNVGNVKELMAQPDIDGCLVGGASLTADSFAKIIGYERL